MGHLFSFISAIFSAAVYFFSHEAMKGVSFSVFLFYWNFFAVLCFLGYLYFDRESGFWSIENSQIKLTLFYLIFEVSSSVLFFQALKYSTPVIASFASQSYLIFIFIIGLIFLKEKFSKSELFGSLLVFIGLLIISISNGKLELNDSNFLGIIIMLSSSFIWAISNAFAKKIVLNENPIRLSFLRSFVFFIYGFLALIYNLKENSSLIPSNSVFLFLFLGGLSGPFLSLIFRYKAMKLIEVSKVSLITTQYPVLVMIISYIIYKDSPNSLKILGGIVTIIGSLIFALKKLK